jgi:hypothetical protein
MLGGRAVQRWFCQPVNPSIEDARSGKKRRFMSYEILRFGKKGFEPA